MAIKFPSIVVLFRPLDAADFFRQAFGLRQSKKHLSSSGKSLKRRSSSKEGGKRKGRYLRILHDYFVQFSLQMFAIHLEKFGLEALFILAQFLLRWGPQHSRND
eukprot:m.70173 g.70173  ORF g.70173 m.70173 type:complete len:104 (+) comp35663_c0_seq2:831-1142(+)